MFKYNRYKNHIYIKFDDYKDIIVFNIAFNNLIKTMIELEMEIIFILYFIIYIIAVVPLYSI